METRHVLQKSHKLLIDARSLAYRLQRPPENFIQIKFLCLIPIEKSLSGFKRVEQQPAFFAEESFFPTVMCGISSHTESQ